VPMSSFVANLRSLVGNELLQMPSVAALCRDESDRLLLVRQADSGRWSTPGGVIEPGEGPEQAATREVYEETGLTVAVDNLRTAVGGPDYRTTYSNGDRLSYVALIYDAHVVGGQPTPDHQETIEVGWFHMREVAQLAHDHFLALLLRDGVVQ
jgi:8-oxo-dGTP pyrophosphatase MutT (NUDIX family)